MAMKFLSRAIAGAMLFMALPTAVAAQTGEATTSETQATEQRGGDGISGGTWIVSILALLAVAGGIVAAASGDSQPESP